MAKSNIFSFYLEQVTSRVSLHRALRVAIPVGILLNLINNPQLIFNFSFDELHFSTVILTFLVPFLVSSYSSFVSTKSLKVGKISHLDALLKCKNCKKANFNIQIGQAVQECPQCKEHTHWKPIKINQSVNNDEELLKSLALFARYNPQPLFRIDSQGYIIGANPSSEKLFKSTSLTGQKLNKYIPEINNINIKHLILHEKVKEILVSHSGKFFNLMLRGVQVLDSAHVYGNDITEIIIAEKKIENQAKEIQESIQYALRIQTAMLPDQHLIDLMFPNNFIFYRPRNTVSGDFYWANRIGDLRIIAVADCTGHGVPGAFMSIMSISLLNEIILREEMTRPDMILNTIRERLLFSFKTNDTGIDIADGIDIALVVINDKADTLSFAGAYNPLYILRNGELLLIEADRMPVGKFINDTIPFSQKIIPKEAGDRLILFSDGYKDQNGGQQDKKFSTRSFKKLMLDTALYPIKEQALQMEKTFDNWKGSNEQIDDVLVIGIELN